MPYDKTDVAYLRRKQDLPTDLTTREMGELDYQIRERAFWSATVGNAKVVNAMHHACVDFASGKLSMSEARMAMDAALRASGYKPADGTKGSMRDLNTMRRQNIILQTNLEMAQGYAHLAEAQEDLDLFPCWEFLRVRNSKVPRTDWQNRWKAAGGKLYGGRMIAPINSPIWSNEKLNRFKAPYPPFDFNSGMGVEQVRRDEAISLGVIKAEEVQDPKELPSMNENLETEIRSADESLKAAISEKMQGFADWDGDKLVFTDPNGTKPYSAADIVKILNKPLPANFYGDGKSPYHQRDVAIEWSKDSSWIKNHTASDKAYHFGRLLKRIEPIESETPVYRGMSWNTNKAEDLKAYKSFIAEISNGFYTRKAFESYTSLPKIAEKFGEEKIEKVVITVLKHKNAKDISKIITAYNPQFAREKEVLFPGFGKMKIVKTNPPNLIEILKSGKGDVPKEIYLTVEEAE